MQKEEIINLISAESDKQRIKEIISQNHSAGIDTQKAIELGLVDRISFLVCAIHSLNMTAYRMLGEVDVLFDMAGSRRHEVKKELENVNKAFDRFISFFRNYQTKEALKEMNSETEHFYHQYMRWCQLPEGWKLGDPQNTDPETEPMVKVSTESHELCFFRSTICTEQLAEPKEAYCVTCYDPDTMEQRTVEDEVDKKSVGMVAKRMSADDPTKIYTASKLVTQEQRTVDALPLKIFSNGELIGDYRKIIKKSK